MFIIADLEFTEIILHYLGKIEIEQFLTHLATNLKVSPTTQNQAFNALLFLYEQVLD
ncbi:MAG: phage integrase N-terminal SAM-like domain-containing protein, partial [Campylobacterales bacterium]|nr:phage integrase N-terminal SAM-like domain-containing protein [Campylobacterales bacterium]